MAAVLWDDVVVVTAGGGFTADPDAEMSVAANSLLVLYVGMYIDALPIGESLSDLMGGPQGWTQDALSQGWTLVGWQEDGTRLAVLCFVRDSSGTTDNQLTLVMSGSQATTLPWALSMWSWIQATIFNTASAGEFGTTIGAPAALPKFVGLTFDDPGFRCGVAFTDDSKPTEPVGWTAGAATLGVVNGRRAQMNNAYIAASGSPPSEPFQTNPGVNSSWITYNLAVLSLASKIAPARLLLSAPAASAPTPSGTFPQPPDDPTYDDAVALPPEPGRVTPAVWPYDPDPSGQFRPRDT